MADHSHADLVLLESLAGLLGRSGGLLFGVARGGAPRTWDGAEATPIFAELLSRAPESVAILVGGR